MRGMDRKEKVKKISEKLEEDPLVINNRMEKDERVHVGIKTGVNKALKTYLEENKKELGSMNVTSRNKLISFIVEDWCKKNNLKIDEENKKS